MIKKFLIASLFAILIAGCMSDGKQEPAIPSVQNEEVMMIDFNQEVYIWENFLFPTNRTTGRQ